MSADPSSLYLASRRRFSVLVAAALALFLLAAAGAGAAPTSSPAAATSSPGALLWAAPGEVDTQSIDSLACPSPQLCVAVDRGGNVLWSTNPAGGRTAWSIANVDAGTELTGVSCPSVALCVAVDTAGDVIYSTDPTGGAAAWTVVRVDTTATENNTDNAGLVLLRGISCPAVDLCVAVDAVGDAIVSTNPTGGAGAWTSTHIDADTSFECTGTGLACQPPLSGIACPTTAFCAAVDFAGNLLTTTTPAAVAPWASAQTDPGGFSSLFGISCPTSAFCSMVDGTAGRVISMDPAAPTTLDSRLLPDSVYGIWCQSASLCLASVETHGGISALLGSFDPSASNPAWSPSTLGGVTAAACPAPSLCIAGDDEGNIAAGLTTTAISGALDNELLSGRHLPTIAALSRIGREQLTFTTSIAATAKLVWTVPGTTGAPLTIASASKGFSTPGTALLTLRVTPAGRALLKRATGRLTVTAAATFTASTGSVTTSRSLTLEHPTRSRQR